MIELNGELFKPFIAFKSLEERELKSSSSISNFIKSLLTNPVYLISSMLFPLSTLRNTLVSFTNIARFSSHTNEKSLKEVLSRYGYSIRNEKYGYRFSKKTITGEEVGEFRVYKLPKGWTILDGRESLDYLKELIEIASNNDLIYWEKIFEEAHRWLKANKALNKREYENLIKKWKKNEIERLIKLNPEEALEALNSYQEPFRKELIRELANKKEFREAFKRAGIRVIRKRDILKYFLICLGVYEVLDLFGGFPGLIDLGETLYLAANLNPSEAKPWEWDWNQALNLALRTNDINTVSGIFNGNSDIMKFVELYRKAINIIPKDIKIYYSKEELNSIGYKLINSIYADGKFSKEEADVSKKLFSNNWSKRWWIVRDIINSGMINEKYFNEDWDKDGLTNLNEIMQETNPLNELETDPRNWSERYAVIVSPTGFNIRRIRKICEILVKNGYDDKHIYLTLNPLYSNLGKIDPRKEKEWYFPVTGGEEVKKGSETIKDYPLKIDHIGPCKPILAEYFLKDLKELPSDPNDQILIYTDSHGNCEAIYLGRDVFAKELNEVLKKVSYGEAIIVVSASYAGGFVEKLNGNPNLLRIGIQSATESSQNPFMVFFLMRLDSGLSIKDAFISASSDVNAHYSPPLHPVMYFERQKPFMNPLIYKKSNI